jgi:hypothetical protein
MIWMGNMDHIDKRLLITGFILGVILGLLIIFIRDHHPGTLMQIELTPPPIMIPLDFLTA